MFALPQTSTEEKRLPFKTDRTPYEVCAPPMRKRGIVTQVASRKECYFPIFLNKT